MSFASRFRATVADRGRLCVGIDPHATLLSEWGLPDSAAGAREFGLRVVDACASRVGLVKPQVAFFERHGAAGYAALEAVLAAARAAGLLVIADAKRGDIGSTVEAYGEAWLTPGSSLEADAMTAYAYQGIGSLSGVFERAERFGKGVFVVAATSNPEARATQTAVRSDGQTVVAALVRDVLAVRGSGGLVIGATVLLDDYGLHPTDLNGIPILSPGFGAQGVPVGEVARVFGGAAGQVAVHSSRELLGAGPSGLESAIDDAARRLLAGVGG